MASRIANETTDGRFRATRLSPPPPPLPALGRSYPKFPERCCPFFDLCMSAKFGTGWLGFARVILERLINFSDPQNVGLGF